MYVDGTQGLGKVLTSDGSGNASWDDTYIWLDFGIQMDSGNKIYIGDFSQIVSI